MKNQLESGQYMRQFFSTLGQNVADSEKGYLNFWCNVEKSATGSTTTVKADNSRDCGWNDPTTTSLSTSTIADLRGNYAGTTNNRKTGCPNLNTADSAKYYDSQSYKDVGTGWYYHACYNFRSSQDATDKVSGFSVGTQIKYKAGWKLWSANSASATEINQGAMSEFGTYTMLEGACALTMSLAVSTVAALLF